MNGIRPLLLVAAQSLLVRKLRSMLSVLGVICGVMAVMSMISIGAGAKEKVLRDIENLGLTNIYINAVALSAKQREGAQAQRSQGLSWQDVGRLQHFPHLISDVAALREVLLPLIGAPADLTPKIVQVSPNYFAIAGIPLADGRFLLAGDQQHRQPVCVLGAEVAARLGREGAVGRSLRLGNSLVQVVGVLAKINPTGGDAAKISPDNYNQSIFLPFAGASESAALTRILVEVSEREQVHSANILIDRILEITHNGVRDFQMVIPQELLHQSWRTQRLFNLVLALIGGISLLVGGIGIMNIMLATVSERKQEIGLRRAVGASRNGILRQFLMESVLLTVAGGVLGLLTGFVVTKVVAQLTGWPIVISSAAMMAPFLLSVIVGILSGLYPAMHAARLDPIQALRAV